MTEAWDDPRNYVDGIYVPQDRRLAAVPDEPDPLTNPIPGKILTTDQLVSLPEPSWLVRGIVATESMTWIAGAPSAYKSFMAIDWACAVSLGVNTCGGRRTQQGNVIYMCGEGTGGLKRRVEAWTKATGLKPPVSWLPEAVQIGQVDWAWLGDYASDTNCQLLVIDTYARATIGMEENNSIAQGTTQAHMDAFRRRTGAAILGVHHHSAAGRALRGHTSLEGAADKVVTLVKDGNGIATMHHYKQKDTEQEPDEYYRASPTANSIVLTPCEKPTEETQTTTKRSSRQA